MYIDLKKTLTHIDRSIPDNLSRAYDHTLRLRSQLLSLIQDQETFSAPAGQEGRLAEHRSAGQNNGGLVVLTIQEPLPAQKELTEAVEEHWKDMIHAAIRDAARQEPLPWFEKAFVEIEIATPRGSSNARVWDTSNRAILLFRLVQFLKISLELLQSVFPFDKIGPSFYQNGGRIMKEKKLTKIQLDAFISYLREEEREPATIEKYLRDIRAFMTWADSREINKELAAAWKDHLKKSGLQPETVNSKLSALNRFFSFLGWEDCRVKYLKIQHRLFRRADRDLTKEEYKKLFDTAVSLSKDRLALLMETICATGIRVSEVKYITVEAARNGRTDISLKGKIRTILIPGKLCRKLQKYAKKQKTVSGEIFLTRNGKGLSRRQIWAELKALCKRAGVEATKVFPHNLRHLFARTFYRIYKDIVKLADVLGHSSIETTRIYLVSTGVEHARQLERLGLIS